MKKTVPLTILMAAGFHSYAATEGLTHYMTGHTYLGKARYSQPLSSYEECVGPHPSIYTDLHPEEWESQGYPTEPGEKAFLRAAGDALGTCKNNYNANCKVVSARYRDVISIEFPGYRACEAVVVVHGYKQE